MASFKSPELGPSPGMPNTPTEPAPSTALGRALREMAELLAGRDKADRRALKLAARGWSRAGAIAPGTLRRLAARRLIQVRATIEDDGVIVVWFRKWDRPTEG